VEEAAVETLVPLEQAGRAALLQVAGAQAEEPQVAMVEVADWEPEARCVYGPGSSEQCRTERPGCAEA